MPLNMSVWPKLRETKQRRNAVIAKRTNLTKIAKQREWTPDEQDQVAQLEAELGDLNTRVETLEEAMGMDDAPAEGAETQREMSDSEYDQNEGGQRDATSGGAYRQGQTLHLPDGRRAVVLPQGGNQRNQQGARTPEEARRNETRAQRNMRRRSSMEYRTDFARYIETGNMNQRGFQQDLDTAGGFLTAPMQLYDRILKIVDNLLYFRQLATQIKVVDAQSVGVPTLEADPSDSDWTAEIGTVQEDLQATFGRRELRPNQNTKLIKLATKLLRNAVAQGFLTADADIAEKTLSGIEDLIAKRFAYKFRVSQENAFINGNGVGRPLGCMVASTRGISTARDVLTGSATGLTYTGLVNAVWTLRAGYNGRFLLSREFLKQTQGLVDSQNRPLFIDAVQLGMPATIMGKEFMISEYMPNVFTTGLYVGLYGDFSYYLIADGAEFMIMKLMELFQLNNQVGFIGYQELDGMPGMEDAFVRLRTN